MSRFAFLAAAFALTYLLAETTGLFRLHPATLREACLAIPFLVALTLLALALLYRIARLRPLRVRHFLCAAGICLIPLGLWISHYTCFSGDLVVTEGQGFEGRIHEYHPGSIQRGRFARLPQVALRLEKLHAPPSGGTRGEVFLLDRPSGAWQKLSVGGVIPSYSRGRMLRISEVGYSLRYALKGKDGSPLDTGWAALKLYPPGREDFFRLITPHAFNVRYLPTAADGRVLAVRISRNKDLLFSDRVRLNKEVPFDNGLISFDDVRMWARINLVVDRGAPVMAAGLLFLLVGWGMGLFRTRVKC